MRSSTTSDHNLPSATHTYSPTVPLSVYRELAAELQAREAQLDSFTAQNQHLAHQNQQLRQEIDIAVQSVLRLQQVVDSSKTVSGANPVAPSLREKSRVSLPLHPSQDPFLQTRGSRLLSKKVFIEQEAGRTRHRFQQQSPSEMSGWRLTIAILLILATAFGAGYLIVRPLLQSR